MRYEGRIFRPPSEGRSYILQATVGCKHNVCAFCDMYREKTYRERSIENVLEDIDMAYDNGYRPSRVFIADGDALAMPAIALERILDKLVSTWRSCSRIGIYATAHDVIEKGEEALKTLAQKGLGIIYLGLESGDEEILKKMYKNTTPEEMIRAAQIVKSAGIDLSVTVISGLGGREHWESHAIGTAQTLSQMNPDYVGLLTLMLSKTTPIYKWIESGAFQLLSPGEILMETKLMLENMEVSGCVFRSNHASNYISLKGTLPADKDKLLRQIENALVSQNYKPEKYRSL